MRCPLELDPSAELIVGYGARTLDPDTAAAFERHLDDCAACRRLAAEQKAVWRALDDVEWRDMQIPADFDRRLFRRIQAKEQRAWWFRRTLIPATACLALAAMIFFRQPDSTQLPPQPTLQIQQVEHALDDMDLLNQIGAAI